MKIFLAPQALKGSLDAAAVGAAMADGVCIALPDAEMVGAPAGLFALVPLPEGCPEERVLSEASRHGVAVDGLARHTITTPPRGGLVIGFAHAPEAALTRAGQILTAAVAKYALTLI